MSMCTILLNGSGFKVQGFKELDAWRLSDELRQEIEAIIANPEVKRDVKFCDQIRGSVDSACANTAEGFGRYYPAEFRRFLVIARGSLTETQNHLTVALSRKYLSQADFDRLIHLASRAIGANTALQKYLRERRGVGYPAGNRRPKTDRGEEP
jgi:four helix bundle protein